MDTYHKIQTLFKRDMDGSRTGQKGKMMEGQWSTPELEYLADKKWEFTEKVDGTNTRIKLSRRDWTTQQGDFMSVRYGGRTDNAVIPKPLLEHLEATFPTLPMDRRLLTNPSYTTRYHEVMTWMRDGGLEDVTLYGEGYGPKIQGGGKYRDDVSFVLFDVVIGGFWLDRKNVDDIAGKLGIHSVPIVGYGTLAQGINLVKYGELYHDEEIESLRRLGAEWLDDKFMQSSWGDGFEAEGIVARPVVPLFNRKGERIICKIKGLDFK